MKFHRFFHLHRKAVVLFALAVLVGSFTFISLTVTNAAFVAMITNSTNKATTQKYFDCDGAIRGIGATDTLFAYQLTGTDVSPSPSIIDRSGNNFKGTYRGTPQNSSTAPVICPNDKLASYLQNGNLANYVIAGDALAATPALNAFTEEAWIKTTTTTGGHIINFSGPKESSVTSAMNNRKMYMNNAGQIRIGSFGAVGLITFVSPLSYNDGKPHHIVYTMGASGRMLYVDGALVASNSNTTPDEPGNAWWLIGVGINSGWPDAPASRAFTGNIAFAAVYKRALTAAEVLEKYNASIKWVTP